MQYICKKDLPFVKKGEEVEIDKDTRGFTRILRGGGDLFWDSEAWDDINDWFEPKRWTPKRGEMYYWVDTSFTGIMKTPSNTDEDCGEDYNVFQTKEQAEKARLLVIEALKKAHE